MGKKKEKKTKGGGKPTAKKGEKKEGTLSLSLMRGKEPTNKIRGPGKKTNEGGKETSPPAPPTEVVLERRILTLK